MTTERTEEWWAGYRQCAADVLAWSKTAHRAPTVGGFAEMVAQLRHVGADERELSFLTEPRPGE